MSRVKQPKKEINPELLQEKLQEIPIEKGIFTSVKKLRPPIRSYLEYINPYITLSYTDPIKALIFSYLVIKLREFAISCQNPDLKIRGNKEIKESYNSLEKDIKEIEYFLKELIPSVAKHRRESQLLRLCRWDPDIVEFLVSTYVLKLGYYLPASYKGKKERVREEDVKTFWKKEFKGLYPKTIDYRSKSTIACSCLAAFYGCSGDKLTKIYYAARKATKPNKVS